MSKIIDLSVLHQEPLEIKIPNGDVFKIPGEISTKFTIRLMKYQQDVQKLKNDEKAFELMQELVVDILNLDKSKEDIDVEYIRENLDDVRYLKLIIEGMMKHMKEISEDPNYNSLESK